MTHRSIRRAQERKARKEMERKANTVALQGETHITPETAVLAPNVAPTERLIRRSRPVPTDALCWNHEPMDDSHAEPTPFTSAAQLAANRANAQLSCGAVTPDGKATSSFNAVKTALTGRTVLLPSDDAPAYQQHVLAYADDFRPVGARECDLVQSIADTAWRLKRIPCLETAIFAQGHIEFAETFNDHDLSLRASMIELQTYLKYEKQLRNLQLQESRLARRREREMAELRQLQQERRQAEKEVEAAQTTTQPLKPTKNGFVFSNEHFKEHSEHVPSSNTTVTTPAGGQNPGLVTAEAA